MFDYFDKFTADLTRARSKLDIENIVSKSEMEDDDFDEQISIRKHLLKLLTWKTDPGEMSNSLILIIG